MSNSSQQQLLSAHHRTTSAGSSEWEYLDEERQSVTSFGSVEDRESLIVFDVPPRHIQQQQQQQAQAHVPSSPSSGPSAGITSNVSGGIDATGLQLGVTSAASEAMHLGAGYYSGGLESASLASGELSEDVSLEQRLVEQVERLSQELSDSHEQAKLLKLHNEQLGGENLKLKDALKKLHAGGHLSNSSLDGMLISALTTNKTGVAAMASVCVLAALLRRRAGLGPLAVAGALASVVMWLNANDRKGDSERCAESDERQGGGGLNKQVKQISEGDLACLQHPAAVEAGAQ
jgi:hypothetical protein